MIDEIDIEEEFPLPVAEGALDSKKAALERERADTRDGRRQGVPVGWREGADCDLAPVAQHVNRMKIGCIRHVEPSACTGAGSRCRPQIVSASAHRSSAAIRSGS